MDLTGYRSIAAAGRRSGLREAEAAGATIFGIEFDDGPIASPGESAEALLRILVYPDGLALVAADGEFTVFEPPRAVAYGQVQSAS